MIVRIKKDDPDFEIKAGDVFLAKPYWLDPGDKVTLIKRLSDDFDPGCNAYRSQVEVVSLKEPEKEGPPRRRRSRLSVVPVAK